jgi:ABC-type antimicrobial peptide transport system permease subunit
MTTSCGESPRCRAFRPLRCHTVRPLERTGISIVVEGLGARSQQVVRSIAVGASGVIAVGTGIGLGLSVLLLLMRSSDGEANIGIGNLDVYRPAIDPVALLTIAAVTATVGVIAAFVPGRRAARMDPNVTLRHD